MLIDAAVLHHHLDDGRGGGDVLVRFHHTLQGVTQNWLKQYRFHQGLQFALSEGYRRVVILAGEQATGCS